ncbi:MAG: glycosyltransferase family 39 protein [Pseudomonadota bacterium]
MAKIDATGAFSDRDASRWRSRLRSFFTADDNVDSSWLDNVIPSRRFLYPALAVIAALKLMSVFFVVPLADEGYYWLWGQFPAWSYYDHPPLGGWMMAFTSALMGDGLWALRSVTIPVYTGILAIIWFWVRELVEPDQRRDAFLTAAAVFTATPWMMQYTSILFHDYLLIGNGIAAAHFFALFVRSVDRGERKYRHLYLACIFVGLAGLSKYSGVFIGLGFAAWVLFSPMGRSLLGTVHVWLGGGVAMILQAPVIYWNVVHDWPSFRYHLHDRIGDTMYDNALMRMFDWTENYIWMLSPILFLVLLRFLFSNPQAPGLMGFQRPGRWVFIVTMAAFTYITLSTSVSFYWTVTGLLFFSPVAFFFFKSEFEVRLHLIWGIFFCAMQVFNFTVVPTSMLTGTKTPFDFRISHGLHQIADEFAAIEKEFEPELLITTDYRTASLLALTMQRSDIRAMSRRVDMFDFWFEPSEHKGKDALVLVYDRFPETDLVTENFEKVRVIREFSVERLGIEIQAYKFVYAENYSGTGIH